MIKLISPPLIFSALATSACSIAPPPFTAPSAASVAAIKELAPSGTLRAAINFGNPILANRDAASGEARGVSVDLAHEVAKRLGVPIQLVTYTAAGAVVAGVAKNEWDIAFVAIDPLRANEIGYSPPYVVIEGAYLVKQNSPIRQNAEVDRTGVRVAAAKGSAYDLYLTRELKNARIVHAPTSQTVTDLFVAQNLDVAAGVKQQLDADTKRISGVRLLDGRFMVIHQAMGAPKARTAGVAYLHTFIEEMKASGFVAEALKRHNIHGAAVAPAQR